MQNELACLNKYTLNFPRNLLLLENVDFLWPTFTEKESHSVQRGVSPVQVKRKPVGPGTAGAGKNPCGSKKTGNCRLFDMNQGKRLDRNSSCRSYLSGSQSPGWSDDLAQAGSLLRTRFLSTIRALQTPKTGLFIRKLTFWPPHTDSLFWPLLQSDTKLAFFHSPRHSLQNQSQNTSLYFTRFFMC